jgi:TatD DNase family protein
MFWDSHCHLDPEVYGSDEAVDAVVARAVSVGVTAMTTIGSGYGVRGAHAAAAVSARHPGRVWFTVGVHPHDAKIWSDEVREILESLCGQPSCVALGEMGLDFHYDLSPRDQQRRVLREQVQLALSVDQPIVVHDRSAGREVLEILADEGAFDGHVLWHCFTGDVAYMNEIVAMGGFISIPGIVTFKNAGGMRSVAAEVPDDRLLVETDSPYLTPTPHRGTQNEPAFVRHVAEVVAELRGVSPAALGALAASNTRRFYRVTS